MTRPFASSLLSPRAHLTWKIALVEERNPAWIDLYPGLLR